MNNNRGNSNNNNNNNRRRGRGNNNRPMNGGGGGGGGGGQQVNRIDSRARGNAPQLLEKYRKMAQDAHMNGDRVQAEYYLQFADHYFRVTADTRVRMEEQRLRQNGQAGAPVGGTGTGYAPGYQNGGGVSGDQWQDQDGEDEALEFGMDANFPTYDRAPAPRRDEQPRQDQPRRDEQPRQDQMRRDEQPRRDDQGRRDEREPREQQPRENQQREYQQRDNRDTRQRTPEPVADASPAEGMRADEGEPIAQANDNPFIRDGRGPRGPRGRNSDRRVGRRDDNDAPRQDNGRQDNARADNGRQDNARQDNARSDNARSDNGRPDNARPEMQRNPAPRERTERVAETAPLFDPSILPPAIGIRPDTVVEVPVRPERTRAPKAAPAAIATAPAAPIAEDAPAAPKKRGRPRKTPLPEAQVDAEG